MKKIAAIFSTLTVLFSFRVAQSNDSNQLRFAQHYGHSYDNTSPTHPISLNQFPEPAFTLFDENGSVTDSFHFAKKIEIDPAAGNRFRYEMAVSGDPGGDFSGLTFFGVAAIGKTQLVNTRYEIIEKRTEQEWTIFTIEGTLPQDGNAIWFYTAVSTPGIWYFDDISLYQERSPGNWKQLSIYNHSFEQRSTGSLAGFAVGTVVNRNSTTTVSANMAKTGKHSLMITLRESRQSRGFASVRE